MTGTVPTMMWKHSMNFVGILWPNWDGGGEGTHDRKEPLLGVEIPSLYGKRGPGIQKNLSTLYPFFESQSPLR
jgi:hypothetical protein